MKKRSPPQGTYAHALLCTRPTRPPDEEKISFSRYLRSRPTTYTPYKAARCRKDPLLKVPTLTPYYVHALANHQKKNRPQPQGSYAHALLRTRPTGPPEETTKTQPQGTYAHALLRTHPTRPPDKRSPPQGTYPHALLRPRPTRTPDAEKIPSRYLRSRPTTYTPYKTTT